MTVFLDMQSIIKASWLGLPHQYSALCYQRIHDLVRQLRDKKHLAPLKDSFFLHSMFTLRSVLDRKKAVREKKIHRVLYTWRLGLIEYYMCCLRCLRCV